MCFSTTIHSCWTMRYREHVFIFRVIFKISIKKASKGAQIFESCIFTFHIGSIFDTTINHILHFVQSDFFIILLPTLHCPQVILCQNLWSIFVETFSIVQDNYSAQWFCLQPGGPKKNLTWPVFRKQTIFGLMDICGKYVPVLNEKFMIQFFVFLFDIRFCNLHISINFFFSWIFASAISFQQWNITIKETPFI